MSTATAPFGRPLGAAADPETAHVINVCREAISHAMRTIRDDPAKYYLISEHTQTWQMLVSALALLTGHSFDLLNRVYKPLPAAYDRWLAGREADEEELREAREYRPRRLTNLDEDERARLRALIAHHEAAENAAILAAATTGHCCGYDLMQRAARHDDFVGLLTTIEAYYGRRS